MNENEIEEAVDEIMDEISDHKAAGGGVPRSASIAFYEGIIEQCKERAEIIRQELEADGEGMDDEE